MTRTDQQATSHRLERAIRAGFVHADQFVKSRPQMRRGEEEGETSSTKMAQFFGRGPTRARNWAKVGQSDVRCTLHKRRGSMGKVR